MMSSDLLPPLKPGILSINDRLFQKMSVFGFEAAERIRRIRRRITRLILLDRFEVARIGDDDSHFLEMVELCGVSGILNLQSSTKTRV